MARTSSHGSVIRIEDFLAVSPRVGGVAALSRSAPCMMIFDPAGSVPAAGDIIVPRNTGWPSLDNRPFIVSAASATAATLADSDTTGEQNPSRTKNDIPPATFDIPAFRELCRATFALTGPGASAVDVTTLCDDMHRVLSSIPALATWAADGFYDYSDYALRLARDAYRSSRFVVIDVRFPDESGVTFAATVNTLAVAGGINAAVTNALGGNVNGAACFYGSPESSTVGVQWPLNDPDLIADLDFTTGKYWSGSLGTITAAQAIDCVRPSSMPKDYAFDADGRLVEFAINAPRITSLGLWSETINLARVKYNTELTNAVWTRSASMVLTQDLPSPFASGTPPGWRLQATAANQTLTQLVPVIAAASTDNFSVPSALFYWDGTPLGGAIQLTQDSFTVVTDIRPRLRAGKWTLIAGDTRVLPVVDQTFGVRIVTAGDSIGFMCGNLTRSATVTTPVVSQNLSSSRNDDQSSLHLASFPAIWNRRKITVLMAVWPGLFPDIPAGSVAPARRGWTAFSLDNPFDITARGRGKIMADVLTIATYTPDPAIPGGGAYVPNDMLATGTGVVSDTKILSNGTGTGQTGTYNVHSKFAEPTQTTVLTDLVIEAREPNYQRLTLNAVPLPPDDPETPNAQHVGVTVQVENVTPPIFNGFDPQTELYVYNDVNGEGFSVDMDAVAGMTALRGDVQPWNPATFHHAPVFRPDMQTALGCQGLIGGNVLNGYIPRFILVGRAFSAAEMSSLTLALEAKYRLT